MEIISGANESLPELEVAWSRDLDTPLDAMVFEYVVPLGPDGPGYLSYLKKMRTFHLIEDETRKET